MSDFPKKVCNREITLWITLVQQTTYFAFFVFLLKACLQMNNFTMRQSFKSKNRTCQKLNKLFQKMCRYLKRKCSQKTTFWTMLLHEGDSFCVRPIFEKHHLESRILQCVILGIKKSRRANCFVQISYNASEFEMRPIQRFRKWIEKIENVSETEKMYSKGPLLNFFKT